MLKSKGVSVTSTTGPLWVAAFFLKKLKKAQVVETQIPFCVDKILHEEMHTVSYRVLAYLLLGVVRIYSKKVEYVLNDSDKVLIKINKCATDTNVRAPMETMCMSIAMPKIFALDALDLDIPEDYSRDHIASQEEITLKEVVYETEEPMRFSDERFEDFDYSGMSGPADHLMMEEYISETFGISMLSGRENETTLSIESLNDHLMTEENISETFGISMLSGRENETTLSVESLNDHLMTEENISETFGISMLSGRENETTLSVESLNDHLMTEENISETFGISILSGRENETTLAVESSNESQQVRNEDNMTKETTSSYQIPQIPQIPQEGVDVTPQSRFQCGSTLIGRSKPGASATPESMPLSTPSAREPARFSRKRKAVFDKMIVLPAEVLKKSIEDASDMVANPKKFRPTLLSMQRQARISRLPNGFYESLLPCDSSSKLQSLFSTKALKLPKFLVNVETRQKLDVPESQTSAASPEQHENAPQIPAVMSELQTSVATAPTTPPLCQNATSRSMKHTEREELLDRNDIPMEELDAISLNSYENLEMGQCFTADEDLNPINEDVNSSDAENSKLTGWSERTRKFAKHLHKSFVDPRKQKEGDVVNFSQVSEGRTRKECARLFHELLVLKSTSYVDVQQSKPYGDIAIHKLPKLDQTFGVDT